MWTDHLYLRVIVPATVLFPISIGLARYPGLSSRYKTICYYLLFAGAMNLVSTILAARKIPNLYLLHWYTMAELLLLSLFFAQLPKSGIPKKTLLWTAVIFVVMAILNFLFLQPLNHFNTYSRPVEASILSLYCVIYFYRAGLDTDWKESGINWIVSGMLLYFSGAFLLFVFSDIILKESTRSLRLITWNIHATLVMFMYLLFTVGLYHAHDY